MANPLDAALEAMVEEHGEKVAAPFMSNLGHAFAAGAGTALAGAGVAAVGVAAEKVYDAMTKARDFRAMMSSPYNQDLQTHYQQKPKEFNAAFSSFRAVAPAFSKDPMVAGTYMRRLMEYDPSQAGGALLEALSHGDAARGEHPVFEAMTRGGVEGARSGFLEGMKGHAQELSQGRQHENALSLEEAKQRMGLQSGMALEDRKHHNAQNLEWLRDNIRKENLAARAAAEAKGKTEQPTHPPE